MKLKLIHFYLGIGVFLSLSLLSNSISGFTSDQVLTGACALIMIYWWVTETLPLAVTALLPAVLLPMTGVMSMNEATSPYAGPIIFLFLGGFLLALAIEKWGLHRRIALTLLKKIGTSQRNIIAAFIISTAFLSMWISNTATAVIMVSIALSIIQLLEGQQQLGNKNFPVALLIAVAYAANIGGLGSIIGSPPNAIMVGLAEQTYGQVIGFSNWMMFAIPSVIVILILAYYVITRWFYPVEKAPIKAVGNYVAEELGTIGKIKGAEFRVLVVFVVVLALWILRAPINSLIGYTFLTDPMIALLGGISLFIIPSGEGTTPILVWEDSKKLSWGILLLFGGALSLAAALDKAGTLQLIGDFIAGQGQLNHFWIMVLCIAVMVFITELMGGTALTAVFVPVLFSVADKVGMDPILLALPVTLASNCSFMLPIATPPNAIVFTSGHLEIKQMIRSGWVMNILAIVVLLGFTFLLKSLIIS